MELKAEKAFVKALTKKPGQQKTKLTLVAPMTPKLARALGVASVVYNQEGLPKQEILECKLEIPKAENLDLRIEVPALPETLVVNSALEATDWLAKRKGSTKKGKPSRLMLQFNITFAGSALGVFEWLEKYGTAEGTMTLTSAGPEQINLSDPASRRKPKKKAKDIMDEAVKGDVPPDGTGVWEKVAEIDRAKQAELGKATAEEMQRIIDTAAKGQVQ